MQCTPEPNVFQKSMKCQRCYDCTDSGYSDVLQSPWRITDSCRSLSPVEFVETPKENFRVSAPYEKSRKPVRLSVRDSRGASGSSAVSWCETPKICKRDASLRQRLLMCKPNADANNGSGSSLCSRGSESPVGVKSENRFRASMESLDKMMGALGSDALHVDQDQSLSGRKRRLLFSEMRTSTLNDGNLNFSSFERRVSLTDADFGDRISTPGQPDIGTPDMSKNLPESSKENGQSSNDDETNDLYDSSSVLCTPSSSHTPKYIRSMREDSGFCSLDKSQDSSLDHDGSFQDLLRSASKGNDDTPHQGEPKRRSRLQRQHRLSTLKEGGSQSEEDSVDKKQRHPPQNPSRPKDNVFTDATPRQNVSAKCDGNLTSSKQDYTTPLRRSTAKLENTTPHSTDYSTPHVPPLRKTPVNLCLTPALQLVHAMCQQSAQMFAGPSPGLKEQLKLTASLVETPEKFKTTMPLAGLIGRKMGCGKVDILTELKKRNLRHILADIFTMLDLESISSFAKVCKSWDEIIQQDKQASLRRSQLKEVGAILEQSDAVHVFNTDTRATLIRRSALKTVQAQSRTSTYCTPQSGNGTLTPLQHGTSHSATSGKRNKFLEVAKTLFSDECLRACPRCDHPARCHSVKREGVCSRADCSFQFCTSCLCSFHGSRECGSQSAGRRKKDVLIPGSAESKRNVRRL